MEYILLIVSTVFVSNIVFAQFLGICPLMGVSSKVSTSLGMAGAVMFVMVIATIVTYLIWEYVLLTLNVGFIRTIVFILVIAFLVQIVEIILKKSSPALYQALGIFLPLITTNCAILGVAVLAVQKDLSLMGAAIYAVGNSLGFGLAMIIFAGIREQLELANIPVPMRGIPIAFITVGLLALAFMGFAGIV